MTWGGASLFADNKDMWGILLVPIILLWLVGGIIIGTVCWVRRGFTGPGKASWPGFLPRRAAVNGTEEQINGSK